MTEPTTEPSPEVFPATPKRPMRRKTKEASPSTANTALPVSSGLEMSSASVPAKKPARKTRLKPAEASSKQSSVAAPVAAPVAVSPADEKPNTGRVRKPALNVAKVTKAATAATATAADVFAPESARVAEPLPSNPDHAHEQPSLARARSKARTKAPEVNARGKKMAVSDLSDTQGEEQVLPKKRGLLASEAIPATGKRPRTSAGTKRATVQTAPPHEAAQGSNQHSLEVETWSPGERAAIPSGDASRKPYPVYVPLHVAKQMEQEGKPAPLAVAPDAQQAAEIRAASYENRHGGAPSTYTPAGVHPRGEQRRGQKLDRGQDRGQDRGAQGRHGERYERSGQDRHDRKRSRHDRRRDGRDEPHPRDNSGQHSHEGSRELPPPTPEELSDGEGIIEISGKGFGFLRDRARNYVQSPADIFVSPEMVRRFNLRDGQWIKGTVRKSGRGQQIHEIHSVNGDAPEASKMQPVFDELTVINPSEPLWMATTPERYTTRIIDMVAPIGKGQRGLIVAPPRTGKTTFLQHIAEAMMKNHPEVQLIMLLVDERPEEVTEIRHTVPKAEIMASSNDMDVRSHTRIAELAIERAKRLVEAGKDVFILLDSITRLGRAFNNAMTNGGRTMSGGIDARAMETPRKLFAAARNTEEAGSLTIIATALIETGSRMDEIIFQEFKGTGNMELVLDRKIAEQRIYPAVDIFQSGTRREELLVPADTLQKIHFLRRGLAGCRAADAIDRLLFYLKKFQTNEQMLREIRG